MSEQIPAGWYPDPQDTTSAPRPQRWWDGRGWTASTRPAPGDAPPPAGAPASAPADATADAPTVLSEPVAEPAPTVLTGEVLEQGAAYRYPEPPAYTPLPKPKTGPSRPVLIAAAVAAVAGLLVGSGVTYLAMDGRSDRRASERVRSDHRPAGDGVEREQGAPDAPGSSASPKSPDGRTPDGTAPDGRGGRGAGLAVDVVNKLSLAVPSGWQAGTTKDGFAAMSVGSYACASGEGECSLGGANTGRIDGTDAKKAAEQDIDAAAQQAYGKIKSHEQLKSEPIAVDGRDGWLVRWKVDSPEGNDGYVQTVVFPTADGKGLSTLHLGFDIADKAPTLSQMDKIVESVKAFNGKIGEGDAGAGTGT
ncbi:DUF2510 domain-containing protein [Kitasatospora sp. NPDC096147]|uniref:DUF2510 domain-containing protein n=1 Tax=Kitasatospora sp. NPDC096147 TaxID=3364093 RepID=UPI00381F94FC